MQLDTNSEGLTIMRRIGGQKKNILNRNNRHLFGDKCCRGTPLDVNGLLHKAGLGDYQMSQINAPQDPYKLDKSRNADMLPDIRIVAKADPNKQSSLQSENIPDLMDAEQTWT